MPIQYDPAAGTIVLCDYATGFKPPEMVKRRPVVVVSPRLHRRRGLCTVAPLSTTPPDQPQAYHHLVRLAEPLPERWGASEMWVKADMVATVSHERLDLFRTGRDQYGKRKYLQPKLSPEDLEAVRRCIALALGIPLT